MEKIDSEDSFGGSLEDDARITGYYIQDQIKLWDRFFTTLGLRLDDHDEFGSEVTYRITAVYLFEDTGTKIKTTYGTGFKAPSLYQLFAPPTPWGPIGNPDLEPERSRGFDVGLEQELWDGKVLLGVTRFDNSFRNLIDFDFVVGYVNRSKAKAKGVELFASIQPSEDISIHANYTYTDTQDESTGQRLARRPKDKIGLDVNYRFIENGNANLGIVYTGNRLNSVGGKKMGGYTVVSLAASYDINEHFQVFGRVENLLDKEYEEVDGFGTPGFSVFGGLKLMF